MTQMNEVDRIADNIMRNDVLANCSQLVSKLADGEYQDHLLEVLVHFPERYCEDQYRYVVDLDECGEYRASIYKIDEETGEDSREPVATVNGDMFTEGGELEGLDKGELGEIIERLHALPSIALEENEDPETEEGDPEEALEHWIVTDWLADKLADKGEMILKDFMGLTIWGRTTSGQAISMDAVIRSIAKDLANK